MKVLFDTNVILDFSFLRRPFYEEAYSLFSLARDKKIEALVGASVITDIYYISRKHYQDKKRAFSFVTDLLELTTLVDTKAVDIQTAVKLGFPDFEDAVVSATALREGADYIITRNAVDFKGSSVPAVTPAYFLQLPEVRE